MTKPSTWFAALALLTLIYLSGKGFEWAAPAALVWMSAVFVAAGFSRDGWQRIALFFIAAWIAASAFLPYLTE